MNEPERLTREIMAMIVTRDLFDGAIVNLGVGLPLECANFLSPDKEILLHSDQKINLLFQKRVLFML